MFRILVIPILISSLSFSQSHNVKLDSLTTLNLNEGLGIVSMKNKPKENLKLPQTKSSNIFFINHFYSWNTSNDHITSIMVEKFEEYELLYVDKNNNEDLTDDGAPLKFSKSENELVYEVRCEQDQNQILRQVFFRKPILSDKQVKPFLDDAGNLVDGWAIAFNKIPGSMETRAGNFYFDDRLTLKRGEVILHGRPIMIGLFDFTNNGAFDDIHDLILIDNNLDGNLNAFDFEEAYQINEVVSIGGESYHLSDIDKYGNSFQLTRTHESPTKYYVEYMMSQSHALETETQEMPSQIFTTIDGEKIDLTTYVSGYILLNFWGEWCSPCVSEIPELIKIQENLGEKVKIISFLYTKNIENAKKMIIGKNMNWPHIILDEELKNEFRIKSFPTNILVNGAKKIHERRNIITFRMIKNIVN